MTIHSVNVKDLNKRVCRVVISAGSRVRSVVLLEAKEESKINDCQVGLYELFVDVINVPGAHFAIQYIAAK